MTPESSPAKPEGIFSQVSRIRDRCLGIVSEYGVDKRNPLGARVGYWVESLTGYMVGHTIKFDPHDFASFSRIRTVDASVFLGDGGISRVKIESFERGNPRESKYIRVHVYPQSFNPKDPKTLIILIPKGEDFALRVSRFTGAQVIKKISDAVLAIDRRAIQAFSSSANR